MIKIKRFIFGFIIGGIIVGGLGYVYTKQSIDLLLWSNNMHYASQIENNLKYKKMLENGDYDRLNNTLKQNTEIRIESLKNNLSNQIDKGNSYYKKVFRLAEESGFILESGENI